MEVLRGSIEFSLYPGRNRPEFGLGAKIFLFLRDIPGLIPTESSWESNQLSKKFLTRVKQDTSDEK